MNYTMRSYGRHEGMTSVQHRFVFIVLIFVLAFTVMTVTGCGGGKGGTENLGGRENPATSSENPAGGENHVGNEKPTDAANSGGSENPVSETPAPEEGDSKIDITGLAMDLVAGVEFKDQLSSMSEQAFYALYAIEPLDVSGFAVYAGSGATAEEVAVIEAADADSADVVEEAVQGRIVAQRDGFENYVPEELTKLADPVMVRNGNYVILCVSDDNAKAREIIGEYFK